jgi:hypothetical protein
LDRERNSHRDYYLNLLSFQQRPQPIPQTQATVETERTHYDMPNLTHDHFLATTTAELNPVGFLEQIIASEIAGATYRLHRCNSAEANLGEIDPSTDPIRRSIERSRSAAMLALNRANSMLRKLQNERRKHEDKVEVRPEESVASEESGSNCKTTANPNSQTPRNAHCPCNSGLKFKRCCGRNAAPVLSQAA